MSLAESIALPLGTLLPPFQLPDAFGKTHVGYELMGSHGLLVVFICNHCPYANAQWPRLVRLAAHGRALGIHTVAINPNIHPDYPEDAADRMPAKIRQLDIDFPYLVDASQEVARAFQAQCTPDSYLFDARGGLVYHGRIDDSWKDENRVRREELKVAMDGLAAGKPSLKRQWPSLGCSIKWRQQE